MNERSDGGELHALLADAAARFPPPGPTLRSEVRRGVYANASGMPTAFESAATAPVPIDMRSPDSGAMTPGVRHGRAAVAWLPALLVGWWRRLTAQLGTTTAVGGVAAAALVLAVTGLALVTALRSDGDTADRMLDDPPGTEEPTSSGPTAGSTGPGGSQQGAAAITSGSPPADSTPSGTGDSSSGTRTGGIPGRTDATDASTTPPDLTIPPPVFTTDPATDTALTTPTRTTLPGARPTTTTPTTVMPSTSSRPTATPGPTATPSPPTTRPTTTRLPTTTRPATTRPATTIPPTTTIPAEPAGPVVVSAQACGVVGVDDPLCLPCPTSTPLCLARIGHTPVAGATDYVLRRTDGSLSTTLFACELIPRPGTRCSAALVAGEQIGSNSFVIRARNAAGPVGSPSASFVFVTQ